MKIHLPLEIKKDLSYDIITGSNTFQNLPDIIKKKFNPDKNIIITDENVYKIYSEKIQKELIDKSEATKLLIIKPGEESKSQKVRDELENKIIDFKPSRNSMVIALGGGVVGDLAGFLASTILRGIRYIQIPTTIIAQVDSSIGGKTGINTRHSKNLIGTFHQPSLVLVDYDFIDTLTEEEFYNGLAEVIKSLLIGSKEGFQYLENNIQKVFERDKKVMGKLISESIKVKTKIVTKDVEEKNLRKILNFGHTIGHAIESLSNYKLKHGFAVAEGMIVESYLSLLSNNLNEVDLLRIQYIVNRFNLDKLYRKKFSFEDVYEKMTYDKKKIQDKITFSLLRKIGKCTYNNTVEKELVKLAFNH